MVFRKSLEETYEGEAKFWEPDKEDQKWTGSFEYKPSEPPKIRLQDQKFPEEDIDVLHGTIVGLGSVTAFLGSKLGYSVKEGQDSNYFDYVLRDVLVGAHLDEIEFNKASIRFTGLNKWMNAPKPSVYNTEESEDRIEIEYDKKEFNFSCCDVENHLRAWVSQEKDGRNLSFKQKSQLRLAPTSSKKLGLSEIKHHIDLWKDFLSLCIGQNVSTTSIELKYGESDRLDNRVSLLKYSEESNDEETLPGIIGYGMFSSSELEEYFKKFESLKEDDRTSYILSTYFALRKSSESYPVQKYVNYFNALDSILNERSNNLYIDKKDFRSLRYDISEKISETIEEYKEPNTEDNFENLEDRMKNILGNLGNKKSLRDKLKSLNSETEVFAHHGISDERIDKLVDTRHHYTHYGETPDSILSGYEIQRGCIQLRMMLEWEILQILGIPKKKRDEQIKHFYLFNRNY